MLIRQSLQKALPSLSERQVALIGPIRDAAVRADPQNSHEAFGLETFAILKRALFPNHHALGNAS